MTEAWEDPELARSAIPNPHCSECGQWGSWRPREDGMLVSGIEHLPNCWVVTGVPKRRWGRQEQVRVAHPRVTELRQAMKEGTK